jgi:hypothetical protein
MPWISRRRLRHPQSRADLLDAALVRIRRRLAQLTPPSYIVASTQDSFTVSTNPAHDATAHTITRYPLPAEMTATGEIVDGKPNIHAVMAGPRQAQMKSEPPSTFTVAPVTYPFR